MTQPIDPEDPVTIAALETLARRYVRQVKQKPPILLLEHLQRMGGSDCAPPVTTAAQVLGEQAATMFAMALVACGEHDQIRGRSTRGIARMLLTVLPTAKPFLWRKDVVNAVWSSPELPRHVIGAHVLRHWSEYHTFEVCYDAVSTLGDRAETDWFIAFAAHDMTAIVTNLQRSDKSTELMLLGVRPGQVYPDDFPPSHAAALAPFLKMSAFLDSKIAVISKQKVERAALRRAARAGDILVDQEASIIALRSRDYDHPASETEREVRWNNRWWVRGHFRAQWIPSDKTHKVIWVDPYIKGPENKPFKAQVYDVCR